jgi:hypothetical protein
MSSACTKYDPVLFALTQLHSSPSFCYARLMSPEGYTPDPLGAFLMANRTYPGHGNPGISIPQKTGLTMAVEP